MREGSPKISVITGYYKRPKVVERTLQALLDQTETDIEIIVFDDASPDNTAAEIRAFVEKASDPRLISIYHEKNIGFVRGLIDAVGRAKGKYIAIQGSGDISLPRRLELQSKILDERPDVGVVGCYYENVIEAKGIRRLRTPNADEATPGHADRGGFSHGEVMFRRSCYDQVGGYRSQFEFCQDADLWLRMIKVCRFSTVKELLYTRFVDFEGVSYKPEKFVAQAQFALLARKLARMTDDRQKAILKGVSRQTLATYVPLSDWVLQKKVIKAVLRAVVWGNNSLAEELARGYIVSPVIRVFLNSAVALVDRLPFSHRVLARATRSRVVSQEQSS